MKKVAIVGAGLAGLSAGYRLKQEGFDVEIFEARHRPGGRVASIFIGDSYEELGGKNILDGGDAKNILSLISELGLETVHYQNDLSLYWHGKDVLDLFDNYFKSHDFDEKVDDLRKVSLKVENLEQAIEKCFPSSPEIRNILFKLITTLEGLEPKALSTKGVESLVYLLEFFREKKVSWCHLKGGNSMLPLALGKKLEGCLYYNHVLTDVYSQGQQVRLVFNGAKTVDADVVVFAMPATTFSDIKFSSDVFPEQTLRKIQSLPYAVNSKILIPLESMLGRYELVVLPKVNCWFNFERSIMTAYSGGLKGVHDFSTAKHLCESIMSELNISSRHKQPLVDSTDALYHSYKGPVFKSWILDPYAKGSYSNLNLDSVKEYNKTTDVSGESLIDIFKPIKGQIYFAGEHTSNLARGTMEGAVASGVQASRVITRFIKS